MNWLGTSAILIAVMIFQCTACTVSPEAKQLPGWCERAGQGGAPDQTSYIGRADGASSPEEALKLAAGNALAQLTQELGVTVSTESNLVQSEVNGKLDTRVQAAVRVASKEVEIRGVGLAGSATARLSDGDTGCVTIRIPPSEKLRLERLARNRSLLTVHCTSESMGEGFCSMETVDELYNLLSLRGAKFLPAVETTKFSAPTLEAALAGDAASVIEVQIRARPLDVINGEHFAEANISLKQIDTTDQNTTLSLQVGPLKGGHYTTRDAELAAIKEALSELKKLLDGRQL